MKLKSVLAVAASVVALVCGVATAHAQELKFSYVEQGGFDFSFIQDANPTPIDYDLGGFAQVAISDWTGNIGPESSIYWISSAGGGLFATFDVSANVFGAQAYSGSEAAPVFAPGVFAGVDHVDGLSGVLTITEMSGVPEPATWAMLLIGLGAIGAAMRTARRREGAALTAA